MQPPAGLMAVPVGSVVEVGEYKEQEVAAVPVGLVVAELWVGVEGRRG
ncbi:hypothetical protein ATG_04800 [Desulfurococcaceae archaeon AG1]|nr:hypothetical protein ATG_04800 [Desulfurococcaceae archaeon AG1]